jgi:hypothetical protein
MDTVNRVERKLWCTLESLGLFPVILALAVGTIGGIMWLYANKDPFYGFNVFFLGTMLMFLIVIFFFSNSIKTKRP